MPSFNRQICLQIHAMQLKSAIIASLIPMVERGVGSFQILPPGFSTIPTTGASPQVS